MKQISSCYQKRFNKYENEKRNIIWQVLCSDFFQKFINKNSTVLDIGAGYCEFLNNIKCKEKIAVDINPDIKKFADYDIKIIIAKALQIPPRYNSKIDIVFLSNFLEHLTDKKEVLDVLKKCHVLLKKNGKIIILQPNINLTGGKYWDFIDHTVALNESSLTEALELSGFKVTVLYKRFLPYTTKSNFLFLVNKWVLKAYLKIPVQFRPFAGQSLAIGIK